MCATSLRLCFINSSSAFLSPVLYFSKSSFSFSKESGFRKAFLFVSLPVKRNILDKKELAEISDSSNVYEQISLFDDVSFSQANQWISGGV